MYTGKPLASKAFAVNLAGSPHTLSVVTNVSSLAKSMVPSGSYVAIVYFLCSPNRSKSSFFWFSIDKACRYFCTIWSNKEWNLVPAVLLSMHFEQFRLPIYRPELDQRIWADLHEFQYLRLQSLQHLRNEAWRESSCVCIIYSMFTCKIFSDCFGRNRIERICIFFTDRSSCKYSIASTSGFDNCFLKQTFCPGIVRRVNRNTSCWFTKYSNIVGIATKGLNIILYPLKGCYLSI